MGSFVTMADGSYYWIRASKERVMKTLQTKGPFVELTTETGAQVTINVNQVVRVTEDE